MKLFCKGLTLTVLAFPLGQVSAADRPILLHPGETYSTGIQVDAFRQNANGWITLYQAEKVFTCASPAGQYQQDQSGRVSQAVIPSGETVTYTVVIPTGEELVYRVTCLRE